MNKLKMTGRVLHAPQYITEDNGTPAAVFQLAVRRSPDRAGFDVYNCRISGDLARHAAEYCKQGTSLAVEGELHVEQYVGNDCVLRPWAEIAVRKLKKLLVPKRQTARNAVKE